MVGVRLGLLGLYLVGSYVLSRYLREHLPTPGDTHPSSEQRPWIAVFWIWGASLWVFPGVLWVGLLSLPVLHILVLSFLLPLSCFLVFWLAAGPAAGRRQGKTADYLSAGSILLFTGLALLLAVLSPGLAYARLALFVVSTLTPSILSIWLLSMWAPVVVPLGPEVERRSRNGLRLVLSFFTRAPRTTWVVEEGKVVSRIRGRPFGGSGPGLLITEPENVVVLKSGASITRVAGPGAVLTGPGETPYRVVDLRDQLRTTTVNAITRDGIEVRAPLTLLFRTKRGYKDIALGEPWPYRNQRDVLQAVFAEEVDPTGRGPLDAHSANPWEELPVKIASHRLEQVISFYSLDQLYLGRVDDGSLQTDDDLQADLRETHRRVERALGLHEAAEIQDPLTRLTISKLVLRAVRQVVGPKGFDVHGGGIDGPIQPLRRTVTEQRVEAWKSRFIAKVMDWHASVERRRFADLGRIRQGAREKFLAKMVEETSRKLEVAEELNQRDFVAYHLLSNLIEIAKSPDVARLLPESALPALQQLHRQMAENTMSGGEA
ncbi:MAG: hypothetical protein ACP5HG_02880 [Anaerolineae bacterium]